MAGVALGELRDRIAGKVVIDVREGRQAGSIELLLAGERDGEPEIVMAVMGAVVNTELLEP